MTRFVARSPLGDTRVVIDGRGLGALAALAGDRRALLVADRRVEELHGDAVRRGLPRSLGTVRLAAGERAKTWPQALAAWSAFAEAGLGRDDLVVALGGGAALDAAGFLASTWMRGVPWIAVPTTLLAMADACIGGKTALDLPEGKNLIGTFHPPVAALVDSRLLATQPERDFRAARFELLKYGWLGDRALRRAALSGELSRRDPETVRRAVARALRFKARLVSRDVRDRADRRLLNLGHTFGHALEAAGGYRLLRHGEAVGIGLLAAAIAAHRLGLIDRDTAETLAGEVLALRPPAVPPALVDAACALASRDKKASGGRVTLVLPAGGAPGGRPGGGSRAGAAGARVHPGVTLAAFRGALAGAVARVNAARRR